MEKKKGTYIGNMFAFYFAPAWQSFFTILYLVFFFYFAVFNSGKILVALQFLFYTLKNSPSLLSLDYLFWGVLFLIGLIIPFSVSLYGIFLFFEIWRGMWDKSVKLLVTLALIVGIPFIIIIMDEVTRVMGNHPVLQEFVTVNELRI